MEKYKSKFNRLYVDTVINMAIENNEFYNVKFLHSTGLKHTDYDIDRARRTAVNCNNMEAFEFLRYDRNKPGLKAHL